MPAALLVIDQVSYDQSAVPVLIATHRALTNEHRYSEVQ
jgi:GntR family transcriptional regulator